METVAERQKIILNDLNTEFKNEFKKQYLSKVPCKKIQENLNLTQSQVQKIKARLGLKRERGYTEDDLYADEDGVLRYKATGEKISTSYDKDGYVQLTLKYKNRRAHRIIAEKYIPNPENKPCVNHKNGIKDDSRIENLEWVTYSENEKHSYDVLGKKGQKVPVYGIDNTSAKPFIDTKTGTLYTTRREFGEANGISKSSVYKLLRKQPERFKDIDRSEICAKQ